MEQFEVALSSLLTNPNKRDQQMKLVRKVFDEQDIEIEHLSLLTDAKLEKMGIKQLGVRETILKVLGIKG